MAWICNMYIQTIYIYAYLYMFKSMKPFFVDMPAFFPARYNGRAAALCVPSLCRRAAA